MRFFLLFDPRLPAVASNRSSAIITNDDFALVYNINRNTYLKLALTNVSEAPVLLIESDGLEGVLSGGNILETVLELGLMELSLWVFAKLLFVFCDIREVKRA